MFKMLFQSTPLRANFFNIIAAAKRLVCQSGILFLFITHSIMFSSASIGTMSFVPQLMLSSSTASYGFIPQTRVEVVIRDVIIREIPSYGNCTSEPGKKSITEYPELMKKIENAYGMRPGDLAKLELMESDGGKNTKHKTISDTTHPLFGETAIGNFGFMPSTCKLEILKGFNPGNVLEAAEMTGRLYAKNYGVLRKAFPHFSKRYLQDLAIGSHKANVLCVIRMVRKGTDVPDRTAGDSVRQFIRKYKSIKLDV